MFNYDSLNKKQKKLVDKLWLYLGEIFYDFVNDTSDITKIPDEMLSKLLEIPNTYFVSGYLLTREDELISDPKLGLFALQTYGMAKNEEERFYYNSVLTNKHLLNSNCYFTGSMYLPFIQGEERLAEYYEVATFRQLIDSGVNAYEKTVIKMVKEQDVDRLRQLKWDLIDEEKNPLLIRKR